MSMRSTPVLDTLKPFPAAAAPGAEHSSSNAPTNTTGIIKAQQPQHTAPSPLSLSSLTAKPFPVPGAALCIPSHCGIWPQIPISCLNPA